MIRAHPLNSKYACIQIRGAVNVRSKSSQSKLNTLDNKLCAHYCEWSNWIYLRLMTRCRMNHTKSVLIDIINERVIFVFLRLQYGSKTYLLAAAVWSLLWKDTKREISFSDLTLTLDMQHVGSKHNFSWQIQLSNDFDVAIVW